MRGLAVALVAGLVLGPLAVPADAGSSEQVVGGQVLLPSGPRTAGPVWIDACGLGNVMVRWATGLRYVLADGFRVDRSTRGRPFVLSSFPSADLVISFHGSGRPKTFDRPGVGPERGIVPTWATSASVCLVAGPPVVFRYEAG